jgi:hypothetical protein
MDLAQLVERVAALEETVVALRSQIAHPTTMKRSRRCSCGGETIYHFTRVYEVANEDRLHELSLYKREQQGVFAPVKTRAPLEAYACKACGLVEWHAINLEGVVVDGKTVIKYEPIRKPNADDGPYR